MPEVPLPWPWQLGAIGALLFTIVSLSWWNLRAQRADWQSRIAAAERAANERVADVRRSADQAVQAAERREELWRQAYLTEAQRGVVRDDQTGELLETTRTMTKIWEGVQQILAGEGRYERTQQRDRGGRPAPGR